MGAVFRRWPIMISFLNGDECSYAFLFYMKPMLHY